MEIDLYSKLQNPIEAIDKMGEFFTRCGMFKCSRPEQGKMLALICMVEKKSPTQIMREYHVMDDGTLAPRARQVHAQFLAAGGDIDWELTGDEQTDFEKVVAKATFRFKDKKPRTLSFGIADARRMQLSVDKASSGWRKTPARMCRARLITMAVDLFCPSIAMGADDVDDLPMGNAPTATIDLAQATPKGTVVADVKTPAREVTVEVVAEAVPTAPPAAPAPTPAPAPVAPVTAPAAAPAQKAGELPAELLTQLENAIGVKDAVAALKWLRKNHHIGENEGLANVTEPMARKIIAKPDKFKDALARTATPAAA